MVYNKADIRLKLAKKLVNTLSLKETSEEEFFNNIKSLFSNVLTEEEIELYIDEYKEFYSFDDLIGKVSIIYADNFEEDELLDLINFFNTNTGKMWIKKYPTVIKDIIQMTDEYGSNIAEKIINKDIE